MEIIQRNNQDFAILDSRGEIPKKLLPSEYDLQVSLMQYMALQYPKILVRCDLGGLRLPIGLAKKAKRLNPYTRGWPDILVAEPMKHGPRFYHGLFLELKRCRKDLFTKNGKYRKTKHIEEQRAILQVLRQKGYFAAIPCGFDEAKQVISDYLDRRIK